MVTNEVKPAKAATMLGDQAGRNTENEICSNAMKNILFVVIASTLFMCCSKQPSQKAAQQVDTTNERITSEFNTVFEAAHGGQPGAIVELYSILRRDESAENSETAERELTELLYYKTDTWVEAFSQLSDSEQTIFKTNYHWAYIGEVDFADDSTMTQVRFREGVLHNLNRIRGNSRQQELARYFITLFHSAIVEDSLSTVIAGSNK